MRIGFISTYPPIECGIATYTKYLTDALLVQGMDIYVVTHRGGRGKNVFEAFDYEDGDLAEKAFAVMTRFTPDIVHIQHEFGLYGKHFGVSVIPLIVKFRIFGIPVVVTLHTIYDKVSDQHSVILTSIMENSDLTVVHEDYQLQSLKRHMKRKELTEKIRLIPHGARNVKSVENAKEKLGIPGNTKVLLMPGYFRPTKEFEKIIRLWPEIVKKHLKNDILLLMAGKLRGTEYRDYRNMLYEEISSSSASDSIKVIRGQISQASFDTIISASDLVALPYSLASQSGILAHCFAFGKPIVTSQSPVMVSIIEKTGAGLICDTDQDYIDNIDKLLSNDNMRKECSENALRYVRDNISWSRIARKHIEIYETIVKQPSNPEINTKWMD